MLSPFQVIACRGNHENLFKDWMDGNSDKRDALKQRYGNGLKVAEQTLSTKDKGWLLSLPHPAYYTYKNHNFCISHGSPWNIDTYIYQESVAEHYGNFKKSCATQDVIIMGHTHYQFSSVLNEFLIVNPGSVGQPRSGQVKEGISRDHKVRAEWAIIDVESLEVELKTTLYHSSALIQEIINQDPELDYLKNVLYRTL